MRTRMGRSPSLLIRASLMAVEPAVEQAGQVVGEPLAAGLDAAAEDLLAAVDGEHRVGGAAGGARELGGGDRSDLGAGIPVRCDRAREAAPRDGPTVAVV